jgi:AcrR family transcriptional regulator
METTTENQFSSSESNASPRQDRHESEAVTLPTSGQRGPAAHDRRDQILSIANALFRKSGYRKTSVAEIGKEMGISKAYIYRFFKSKQAIGEAICAHTLEQMGEQLREVISQELSPTKRFRLFMLTALTLNYELLVNERSVNEVVVEAVEGNWCTVAGHYAQMYTMLERIIDEGRQKGEFEKKTPLDEVADALAELIVPYTNPGCLAKRPWSELEKGMRATTNLALRSLAI